jgi:hypothetical protein
MSFSCAASSDALGPGCWEMARTVVALAIPKLRRVLALQNQAVLTAGWTGKHSVIHHARDEGLRLL